MSKNYLPYDLSYKLNKKGYTIPSNAYYNIYNKHIFMFKPIKHNEAIWAPTFGEVINWFKEVHDMDVLPSIESIENALDKI
jgi:hypothetical protein